MKTVKHLSVLLAVLLVVSLLVVGFIVNADDPAVITVTNEEEFAAAMVEANAAATIELANDITLTNGNATVPGTFTGVFDGKGFTLSGITNTLFNKIAGGTVKNVTINGAIDYTGGRVVVEQRKAATIAGDADTDAKFLNIVSNVDISTTANDLNAGGIVGYGKAVTFENVTYAGDYVANWNGAGAGIGGIIGYTNNNGTSNYINCAFTGTMTVNGTANGMLDLGAIIGIARNGENNFENCVNGGVFTVTAPATTLNVSAVVGRNRDNSATISVKNCLNYGTASEGITVAGVIASGDVAVNEGNVTAIPVATADELSATLVDANINAYIILTADIDMTGKDWAPIKVFKGTFDGNGHVISGIHVEQAFESDGYGYGLLIRDLEQGGTGTVKNLTLKDCSLKMTAEQAANKNNHIGGVVGWSMKARFENIKLENVDVSFTGSAKGEVNIGGLIGCADSNNATTGAISFYNCSSDKDCSVEGITTGRLPNVAGLVGRIKGNGQKLDMRNCVNNASVTSNDWAGGLVACIDDVVKGGNAITNCANYGTIKTTGEAAAALVGSAGNAPLTVKDSVAGGAIFSPNKAGAVCGVNNNAVTVENTEESAAINVIEVATADEFRAAMVEANNAAYIILTADIDLGEAGNTAMPGSFTGTFDGNGKTISGLTAPVFAALNGTFKDVTLNGAIEYTERVVGSVACESRQGCVIENVVSNVNITQTAANINAGGILGYAKKATLTNVTYAGHLNVIWNGNDAGIAGIVGWSSIGASDTSTYTDCVFSGTITVEGHAEGNTGFVAPILGKAKGGAHIISKAVNNGKFNFNEAAGENWTYPAGIVGAFEGAAGSAITGSLVMFGECTVNGNASTPGRNFYNRKDDASGNVISSGAFKQADGSFLANDGDGLALVFKYMNGDELIKVNDNVTLPAGTPTFTKADFSGTLDGQGKTVSGLTNPLFKKIVGGTVKNVTFEGNVDFTDESVDNKTIRRYATTIAFEAKDVTLENVTSNVNITVIGTDLNAGGLIGYANEATLTNCTYGGTYTATGDGAVGGIIGYVRTNSGTNTYTNCSFTGTINFDGVADGKTVYIGGLVGKHRQHTVNVVDASVTGTFNVTNNAGTVYVGGFIGTDNDVATLTMSGLFDGTINADGATVDPFLADDAGSPADLTGCKTKAKFDEGTIELGDDGKYTIGAETFAAFLSVREGAEGTSDYRFVIAANAETFKTYANANMLLTFTKDGEVVASATKNVLEDLKLYASATAAGDTYVAADGCLLFGLVVTGVPAEAWDTVTVSLVDDNHLVSGEVKAKDITETVLGANKLGAQSYGFEDHHTDLNCHASWILLTDDADVVAGITDGTYTAVVYLDGEAYTIKNTHNADVWLRMDLETAGATIVKGQSYVAKLTLLDADGNLAYFTDTFTIESTVHSTDTAPTVELPRDLDKYTVDLSTVVADGIATWGDGPATNLFDGKLTKEDGTKIGGGITGSFTVSFSLTEAQTVTYYTFTTGGDTAAYGRNPDAWTLYGKVGEEWVALSTVSNETAHNGFLRMDATSFTWKVENPQACTEYKVEFTSDEGSFQMNELELFGGAPAEQIGVNSYGFENHHADLDNHVAWVIYLFDGRAKLVEDGTYKVVVNVNGTNYPIENISYYVFADTGDGYVRMDLEAAGITGIKRGETYLCEVSLYDAATGEYLYYSQVHEVKSNIFSSDIPTQNVDLPAKDIEKVTVDTNKLGYEGINPWNVEKESVAQLFDGNTEGTKLGGGVNGDTFTVTFSLTAPATIKYYTFTTGGDTSKYADRNPAAWTLYGKVGEEWVALSTVGETLRTGLTAVDKTPFTYAVDNPMECIDYKIVFTKTGGSFQMNELELYTTVGTLLGGGMYNSWFSNENDGTKAFVVWLADSVGGADTVAKIISGEYKTELIIDGVVYTELTNKGAGRYWVIDLEKSGATDLKKGEFYDVSVVIRDADGNRLYYADPAERECVVEFGEPVRPGTALGSGMYNPNFSLENDGTKALVVWLADSVGGADTVAKIISGDYKAELVINGVTYTELTNKGAGRYWVIDLAATGVTGLKNGESYGFSFIISDADGNCLYYSEDLTRECKFDLVPPMTVAEQLEADKAKAIEVLFNSSYGINANKEIGITVKMDNGLFPTVDGVYSISSVTAEGAYVYIKDVTNNGEYVKYDVANYRSDAHYRMYITADGFEPVAGVQYDVWFFFIGGSLMKNPGELHKLNDSNTKFNG